MRYWPSIGTFQLFGRFPVERKPSGFILWLDRNLGVAAYCPQFLTDKGLWKCFIQPWPRVDSGLPLAFLQTIESDTRFSYRMYASSEGSPEPALITHLHRLLRRVFAASIHHKSMDVDDGSGVSWFMWFSRWCLKKKVYARGQRPDYFQRRYVLLTRV